MIATSTEPTVILSLSEINSLLDCLQNIAWSHKRALRGAALNITPLEEAELLLNKYGRWI